MKPSEKRDALIAAGLYLDWNIVWSNAIQKKDDFFICKSCEAKGGFWAGNGCKKASIVSHHERYHPQVTLEIIK